MGHTIQCKFLLFGKDHMFNRDNKVILTYLHTQIGVGLTETRVSSTQTVVGLSITGF